jgi:hypothetical protein
MSSCGLGCTVIASSAAGMTKGCTRPPPLPDPLVLTHYFTLRDDRIVWLIIIRNEPVPA